MTSVVALLRDLVADLAVQLTPRQRDPHALAGRRLRGVAQHLSPIGIPAHRISAAKDRQRAQRLEPARAGAQLPVGAVLPPGNRAREPSPGGRQPCPNPRQAPAECEALVFQLAREQKLDEIIAQSWVARDHAGFKRDSRQGYDIAAIYSQIAKGHERTELLTRSETVRPPVAGKEWLSKSSRLEEKLAAQRKFAEDLPLTPMTADRRAFPAIRKVVEE